MIPGDLIGGDIFKHNQTVGRKRVQIKACVFNMDDIDGAACRGKGSTEIPASPVMRYEKDCALSFDSRNTTTCVIFRDAI